MWLARYHRLSLCACFTSICIKKKKLKPFSRSTIVDRKKDPGDLFETGQPERVVQQIFNGPTWLSLLPIVLTNPHASNSYIWFLSGCLLITTPIPLFQVFELVLTPSLDLSNSDRIYRKNHEHIKHQFNFIKLFMKYVFTVFIWTCRYSFWGLNYLPPIGKLSRRPSKVILFSTILPFELKINL